MHYYFQILSNSVVIKKRTHKIMMQGCSGIVVIILHWQSRGTGLTPGCTQPLFCDLLYPVCFTYYSFMRMYSSLNCPLPLPPVIPLFLLFTLADISASVSLSGIAGSTCKQKSKQLNLVKYSNGNNLYIFHTVHITSRSFCFLHCFVKRC